MNISPYLAVLKEERKNAKIHPFKRNSIYSETQPPPMIGVSQFSSFCVILLTNQSTDVAENTTSTNVFANN